MADTVPIRVGILGAGGLGRQAARILSLKQGARLVAICDRSGYAFARDGISGSLVTQVKPQGSVGSLPDIGRTCTDPIGALIERAEEMDGIFVALPNLPNTFIPDVLRRFCEAGVSCAFTDAVKRTSAMERVFDLHPLAQATQSVVLTGCGATPGLLSAAAVLAAQSFIEVEHVDIHWGVGIAHWAEYKATIREDIAHLPGYSVDRAAAMSDADVDALLAETEGLLHLRDMEHADDLLLQRVGVVDRREQVTVGGVMDTRHARKPVRTTMTLTGLTYEGRRAQHQFILGDETTMAANVIGPALGYMKRALWLKGRGIYGVFGSTEFMPMIWPGRLPATCRAVVPAAAGVPAAAEDNGPGKHDGERTSA